MNGRLPDNDLMKFHTGCWGFVGRVDVRLAYCRINGGSATDAQLELARRFGPRMAGLKSRSFATRREALAALAEIVTEQDAKP
jgi:hypothetical protein